MPESPHFSVTHAQRKKELKERLVQEQDKGPDINREAVDNFNRKGLRNSEALREEAIKANNRPKVTVPRAPIFATDSRLRSKNQNQNQEPASEINREAVDAFNRKGLRDSESLREEAAKASSRPKVTVARAPAFATEARMRGKQILTETEKELKIIEENQFKARCVSHLHTFLPSVRPSLHICFPICFIIQFPSAAS